MAIVTYNGVVLPYAYTTQFDEEPVRDQMSDTDWHLTKYTVGVQTVIHADYLAQLASNFFNAGTGAPLSTNPVDIMRRVRFLLKQHRRTLQVTINGVDMIPAAQIGNPGTVDAMNGPKVQICQYSQLTNTSFLLNFRVVAHYWESLGDNPVPGIANAPGSNILYNRWTESVDLDGCDYSRYTREGTYRIRSDNVDAIAADQAREDMAVLGVLNGCLRESRSFAVSPDGLECHYRVTDREVFKKPPEPAFEADGDYIETTARGMGVRFAEVRLILRGSKLTSQAAMIDVAVAIGIKILTTRGGVLRDDATKTYNLIEHAVLRRSLYKNEVEFTVRAMITPSERQIGKGLNAFTGMNTSTPGSDDIEYTPPYASRGTLGRSNNANVGGGAQLLHGDTGFLLQAAIYWDPSLRGVHLNPDNQFPGVPVGWAGKNKEL